MTHEGVVDPQIVREAVKQETLQRRGRGYSSQDQDRVLPPRLWPPPPGQAQTGYPLPSSLARTRTAPPLTTHTHTPSDPPTGQDQDRVAIRTHPRPGQRIPCSHLPPPPPRARNATDRILLHLTVPPPPLFGFGSENVDFLNYSFSLVIHTSPRCLQRLINLIKIVNYATVPS